MGTEAGLGVTGNSNIIIGEDTSSAITSGASNILIGNALTGLTNSASNQINIGNTITGNLAAASGGTALVIGASTDDGAIMTFAGAGAVTLPAGTSGQRPTPANGMIRYNQSIQGVEAYYNSEWQALSGSSALIDLGTSVAATNPQRNGDASTGLLSAAANTVAVAIGGVQQLTVNASGVGIGIANPTTPLQVGGPVTGTIGLMTIVGTASSDNPNYIGNGSGLFSSLSSDTYTLGIKAAGELTLGSHAFSDTAPVMTISTAGNVGIGTAPTSKLHVADSSAQTTTYKSSEFAVSATSSTSSVNKTGVDIQSTGTWNGTSAINIGLNVNATGGTTNYAALFSGGNVGIGTTAPGAVLDILQPAHSTHLYVSDYSIGGGFAGIGFNSTLNSVANYSLEGDATNTYLNAPTGNIYFRITNGDKVIINSTGNVGIANTSPGALLDVGKATSTLGTLRLEGSTSGYTQIQPNVTAGSWTMTLPTGVPSSSGYVLSSDTSGVTSWVALGGSGAALTLGTSAGATNPQRSGQAGTGLFSATSNTVSIADAGADVMDVAATGPNILGTITQGSYSIGYQINGNNAVWQDATNQNTAVGPTAFPTNVIQTGPPAGQNDTALGYHALTSNTSGGNNTALGNAALNTNSTGYANTAVGSDALYGNTIGVDNVAMGYEAMFGNTTGTQNVAIGMTALYTSSIGGKNTAVGYGALNKSTTGVANTAFGYQAGADITFGGHNVIIGDYTTTGVGITSGSNNILIGQDLQKLTQGSSNQLDIGNLIFATGLGSVTTLSTGSVGIGTSSPGAMLDVGNQGTTLGTFRLESSTSSSYVQLQA